MRSIRLYAMLLVFAIALALPAAGAAQPAPSTSAPKEGTTLRSFLASLWNVAEKIGCQIDPLGACVQSGKPSADIGCKIDPLGTDCLLQQQ